MTIQRLLNQKNIEKCKNPQNALF